MYQPDRMNSIFRNQDLSRVDHIIYGTPDLESTIDALEKRLGVRATTGGQHPGEGTHNALFSLGPSMYLEIMAPDPRSPEPDRPRWLGIDDLTEPRLIAWAAKGSDLDSLVAVARNRGIELGEIFAGSRERPDGSVLSWRLTDPRQIIADGVVPFFIDWGATPHPSESAISGLRLHNLKAEHPDPLPVSSILENLGLDVRVAPRSRPALIATLETPRGVIELR